MAWLRALFSRWRKPKTEWSKLDYGKPSTAGDDFRRMNDV
jgi:hypothetical protein